MEKMKIGKWEMFGHVGRFEEMMGKVNKATEKLAELIGKERCFGNVRSVEVQEDVNDEALVRRSITKYVADGGEMEMKSGDEELVASLIKTYYGGSYEPTVKSTSDAVVEACLQSPVEPSEAPANEPIQEPTVKLTSDAVEEPCLQSPVEPSEAPVNEPIQERTVDSKRSRPSRFLRWFRKKFICGISV